MKLVRLTQNTPEWLHFRRVHIGGSDCPTILGLNAWRTPLELYEEKLFKIDQDDNHFMKRGRELEPIALEFFENETGLTMFPMVFEHDTIPWMAASLDGMTLDRSALVEIKCNGKVNHSLALQGKINPCHNAQIQHQLEVTGLKFAYYYSFDGDKGVIIEVQRDQSLIEILLAKELEFWNCLQTFTPPIPIPKPNKRKSYETTITI